MHQNKLFAIAIIVAGSVFSLALILSQDVVEGECIKFKLFGDSGVERCKEKSDLTPSQADEIRDIIATTNEKLENLKQVADSSQSSADKVNLEALQAQIQSLESQNKITSDAVPYLQQSDYQKIIRYHSDLIKEIDEEMLENMQEKVAVKDLSASLEKYYKLSP